MSASAPSIPAVQPVYQSYSADMASENAGLFERIQRSQSYGIQNTRLASGSQYPGLSTSARSSLG